MFNCCATPRKPPRHRHSASSLTSYYHHPHPHPHPRPRPHARAYPHRPLQLPEPALLPLSLPPLPPIQDPDPLPLIPYAQPPLPHQVPHPHPHQHNLPHPHLRFPQHIHHNHNHHRPRPQEPHIPPQINIRIPPPQQLIAFQAPQPKSKSKPKHRHKIIMPRHHDQHLMRSPEAEAVIRDLAQRLLGTDYWSRDDGVRERSLNGGGGRLSEERLRVDDVRRINAIAQIANATITTRMLYAEVHPKLSIIDGRYPPDFDIPRRVSELLGMDRDTLLRISDAYGLPEPTPHKDRDFWNQKLAALLEYLGVTVAVDEPRGRDGSHDPTSCPTGSHHPFAGYTRCSLSDVDLVASMRRNSDDNGNWLSSKRSLATRWRGKAGGMGQNVDEDGNVAFFSPRAGGMKDNVDAQGNLMR